MSTRLSLHELQSRFLAALYDPAAPGPVDAVVGNGLAPDARLRIYRRSCHEAQTAALRTSYPAVLALVGNDWFDQAARGYRLAHPSVSGNLQSFGAYFGDYLETQQSCSMLPYLPDVARLEWLRQEAILTPEAEPVAPEALACALRTIGLRLWLGLQPGVRLFASRYRVLTIWGYALDPSGDRLALDGEGESAVLWREEAQLVMAALDPASFACIESLARGCPLEEACGVAAGVDSGFDAAQCLESLLEHRLVTGIRSSPRKSRRS